MSSGSEQKKSLSLGEYKRFVRLPVQQDADPVRVRIESGQDGMEFDVRLAKNSIDYWVVCDLKALTQKESLTMTCEAADRWLEAVVTQTDWHHDPDLYCEEFRPKFHFTAYRGSLGRIHRLTRDGSMWKITYGLNPYDAGESPVCTGTAASPDLVHWDEVESCLPMEPDPPEPAGDRFWDGDIVDVFQDRSGGKAVQIARSSEMADARAPFQHIYSLPAVLKESGGKITVSPLAAVNRLRIWERVWEYKPLDHPFQQLLRFQLGPDNWPQIRLLEPNNTTDDIGGDLFDMEALIDVGQEQSLNFEICDLAFVWNAQKQEIRCKNYAAELPQTDGRISFRLMVDRPCIELYTGSKALFLLRCAAWEATVRVGNDMTENVYFDMRKRTENRIKISCSGKTARIIELKVYGLRSTMRSPEYLAALRQIGSPGKVVYKSSRYCVYDNHVEDENFGYPAAWTPDARTILSPIRVTEEFRWRKTPWGDMTRITNRSEVWHSHPQIDRFPKITSEITSFDAAFALAMDVFYECSSPEYTLPGQDRMWTAGLFQGKGEGFGVWVRDSTHVAIRGGNLIDPECARRTLLYTARQGFDNGSDGHAMPIVGIWDYYLATNDHSAVYEAWPLLLEHISRADERFDGKTGLIRADQSSSNDAFPEPEAGGFSFATELYYMKAYEAMVKMGERIGADPDSVGHWRKTEEALRKNLMELYWNEEKGYFTSGPKGSEAYENGYWETCGEEGAVWSRFGLADKRQRASVLDQLPKVAMNEYGINLFPYRSENNHYCSSVWTVWYAGFAEAASGEGREDLLLKMIAQQVRSCIMNKTFYEVIEYENGLTWRWPGQLWHVSGFVSCFLYGVFGIRYDENGMVIRPCVPEPLKDIRLENLRYGNAVLSIEISGFGSKFAMYLDGRPCEKLSRTITGCHRIVLKEIRVASAS